MRTQQEVIVMGQVKTRLFVLMAALAAIVTLGSGCIIETIDSDTGCWSDSECFAGEVCELSTGACISDCTLAGCAFSGDVCDGASGVCFTPECASNDECYVGEFCGNDGLCYEYSQACLGSADCVGDGICTSSNICDMNYECTFDSECPWIGTMCNEFGFCEYTYEF